jgi:hypothetical protein
MIEPTILLSTGEKLIKKDSSCHVYKKCKVNNGVDGKDTMILQTTVLVMEEQ